MEFSVKVYCEMKHKKNLGSIKYVWNCIPLYEKNPTKQIV